MRSMKMVAAALFSVVLLSGCFYAHVVTPLDMDVNKTVLGQKVGKATSQSVLWAAAWGDAGTAAAAKNGGITTVYHMDREIYRFFFGI